ncbi:hypothetical protein [Sphingomonas sp.]|jgi:hypothetical protein|uniref:hypothetical protein n=1 Tax=Sphingomonas sp. TaxID=28214 RepID=UPI00262E3533|nr:hypothetical protein [Sphingomonas sp.]MDF2494539.1 hypothetical protein [Sphingomonas sp.]
MLLATSHTAELERLAAPKWVSAIWNDRAPTAELPHLRVTAPEPPRFVSFYVEDEQPSIDELWTGRFSLAVVLIMALYVAGHFLVALAMGRL